MARSIGGNVADKKQQALINGLRNYGVRYHDNTLKGSGYFGALPNVAEGGISTELSGDSGGAAYPLMHPGATQAQLARLLRGDENIGDIYKSAEHWAGLRQKVGKSPFASSLELKATPGMLEWPSAE